MTPKKSNVILKFLCDGSNYQGECVYYTQGPLGTCKYCKDDVFNEEFTCTSKVAQVNMMTMTLKKELGDGTK